MLFVSPKPKVKSRRVQFAKVGVAVGLILSACSSPHDKEPDAHQHRLVGNSEFVTVEDAGDEVHAAQMASQHCATYGKKAQFMELRKHPHGRYARAIDVKFQCVMAAKASLNIDGR